MCEEKDKGLAPYSVMTRRRFAALSAAGIALAGCAANGAPREVVERNVVVTTPDGSAEATLFHPQGGTWPGVLFWPDIAGLRQSMRDMGRRLAASGYVVLVVNPFYRTGSAADTAGIGMDPARRPALLGPMTPDAVDRDATAFVAYLDALDQTSNAKVGVQGYCMGGPLSFRTAAAAPDRIGAVASFHGAGLATDKSESPHRLIERTNARYLVAIAKNDNEKEPQAKTVLRETFDAADRPAIVEVYAGDHGWCVPDSRAYHPVEAERAWATLLDLYRTSLI